MRWKSIIFRKCSIERCRQCEDNGWGICRSEGKCIIDDDFAALVDGIRGADFAVFANPVYFGDLSETLKTFLDRLRRITRVEAATQGIAGKPAIGISVAGGGGGGAASCSLIMEKVLATCGFKVVDLVPVRRQNLAVKLEILEMTGKHAADYAASKDE